MSIAYFPRLDSDFSQPYHGNRRRGSAKITRQSQRPGGNGRRFAGKFPAQGCLPALYPPDRPSKNGFAPEPDYFLFSTPERSPQQIHKIQAEMPKGRFTAVHTDWRFRLSRTRKLLSGDGEIHILGLGDSIVNDTMRSGWLALLQEAYPKAKIRGTVYVRGGGGCQHYKEQDRIRRFVALEARPGLHRRH